MVVLACLLAFSLARTDWVRSLENMKSVVDEMRRKQPGNEDVKALVDWVRTRASR